MANLLIRDPFLAAPFRLMDELMRSAGNGNRVTGFTPLVDVHETEEEYLVKVDLPGVKADDVNVEVNDNVLSISGSRAADETGQSQLVERPYGSFVRTLTLPQGVDSDSIEAGYRDGVLELRIPKPAEQKPKKITIGGGGKKEIEK
ncbi:MAG TPA: Hsp20/alpha crystallin family protein [Casimicrobiaceae bacterium]|nr:Hsp20/alpha crystallin family protein [Casimicrobiaceae bacterium]